MSRMLITPTLLNGFRWYTGHYGENPEDEQIERDDFLRLLRREPMQAPGESILMGRQLEDDVVDYCKAGGYKSARRDIKAIGDACMGGMWQVRVQRDLDGKFLLYGVMDNLKRDTIRDIKFAKSYDIGRFINSAQHPLYQYCVPTVPKFIYEISDGWNSYREDYHNRPDIEDVMRGKVADFMGYLDDDVEAKELFNTHWKADQYGKPQSN